MKISIMSCILLFSLVNSFAQKKYTLMDLRAMSKYKFGFVKKSGSINEYYIDFKCTSDIKNIYDFNVDCGRSGDIVTLIVKQNTIKANTYDLYIPFLNWF